MGKGVVCPFFSNCLFATSRCIEKEAVDKMIAHFVTAPFIFRISLLPRCRRRFRDCRDLHQNYDN